MFKNTSKLIKICAYIFLIGNIAREAVQITVNTSYLNTGELLGVQSMLSMIWSCFVSFLIASIIYGIGVVIEFFENGTINYARKREKTIDIEDLTKSSNDVK